MQYRYCVSAVTGKARYGIYCGSRVKMCCIQSCEISAKSYKSGRGPGCYWLNNPGITLIGRPHLPTLNAGLHAPFVLVVSILNVLGIRCRAVEMSRNASPAGVHMVNVDIRRERSANGWHQVCLTLNRYEIAPSVQSDFQTAGGHCQRAQAPRRFPAHPPRPDSGIAE